MAQEEAGVGGRLMLVEYRCAHFASIYTINMVMSKVVRMFLVVTFMHHTFLPVTACTVPPLWRKQNLFLSS